MSRVLGKDLDNNKIEILNGLDKDYPNLYEFTFETGKYEVPLGYDIESV